MSTKYDARTGFNDIKSLAGIEAGSLLWLILGTTALVLLLYLMFGKRRPKGSTTKPRTAREFLDRLRDIEKQVSTHSLDIRSAASLVSQTVREYLEVRKSLPALELTPSELVMEFERAPDLLRAKSNSVVALVRDCERVGFSDDEHAGTDEIRNFVRAAEKLIGQLESAGGV